MAGTKVDGRPIRVDRSDKKSGGPGAGGRGGFGGGFGGRGGGQRGGGFRQQREEVSHNANQSFDFD